MIKFGILLSLALLTPALSAVEVSTSIEKNTQGQWSVRYSTATPVQQIAFQRNPDDSRAKHWTAQSAGYSIKVQNGIEVIQRADGQDFTEVAFTLNAVYAPLPKEYAAFSPFSDGGMLLHSGRFFACAEHCSAEINSWTLTLTAPEGEHIIVAGQVHQNEFSWQEKDSGSSVYVGKATPLAGPDFISLVDPALPDALRQQIMLQLPELMAWFTQSMGRLEFRPALFASYSSTDDGSYGYQGGILPGQIFMHWYGRTAIEQLQSDAVFWFFAHEVAHLYQRRAGAIEVAQDAWIHEGAADYMAGLASASVQNNPDILQSKVSAAAEECISGLEKQQSYGKAASANPRLHYSCGLLLNHAISAELQKAVQPLSLFKLWSLFNNKVEAGLPAQAEVFLDVLKPYVSAAFWLQLSGFAHQQNFNANSFMQQLQQLSVTPAKSEAAAE